MTKGYKVFNPDWTCRDFQYEVGQTYEHDGRIYLCRQGFHFCEKVADCFDYYSFDPDNKIAEIEAIGEIIEGDDGKSVTNKICIVREITWEEMLRLANQGKGNSGIHNTGDCNTGYRNTGYRNTGYRNTGNYNTGDCNTGYRNTGNYNTGDCNTGNYNTGDWNLSDHNSGCFNTENHKLTFFDQESEFTWEDWYYHAARRLLDRFYYSPTSWIYESDMTDEEKTKYPSYKTTGGYLKRNPKTYKEEFQEYWNNLSVEDKAVVLTIPNFDAVKFEKITGVNVHMDTGK